MSLDGIDFSGVDPNSLHRKGYATVTSNSGANLVRFYYRSVYQSFASKKEGRTICKETPFIEIVHANGIEITDREVKEKDKREYPLQWEAFVKGTEAPLTGTPIEEWGTIPANRRIELKHDRILTVEQLSEIPDEALGRLGMDGRSLREKARAFLEFTKNTALPQQQAEKILDLETEIGRLRDMVQSLGKGQEIEVEVETIAEPTIESAIPPRAIAKPKGNPPHVPTEYSKALVADLKAHGTSQKKMAEAVGVSVMTLKKRYANELEI